MFTKICSLSSQIEAELVISLLNQHGLNPLNLNISSNVSLGGVDQFYTVQIPTAQVEEAVQYLTEKGYEKNIITS